MSYFNYLNFYASNAGNRGKITKRGRKNNHWLRFLKVGDKVDIFDRHSSTLGWYIGTVVEIDNATATHLKVHYDGWPDKFDERILVDYSKLTSNKIKRFHTITPYHDYLSNSSATPCKWNTRSSEWKRCVTCSRKCCVQCFLSSNSDSAQCRDCMNRLEADHIFHSVYASVYNQYSIDVHIIYLIVDYSLGIAIQCANTHKPCPNEMHFDSTWELTKLNTMRFYVYTPKYAREGTVQLYGENKRLFCEECTKKELRRCSVYSCANRECGKGRIQTIRGRTLCHNHKLIRCTICAKQKDEGMDQITDCVCCGQKHCNDCNVYCAHCQKCAVAAKLLRDSDMCICVGCYGMLENWTWYDDAYDDYTLDDEYIDKYYGNERLRKRQRARKGAEKTRSLRKYYRRKDNKRKNLKYHNKLDEMLMCNISV